MKISNKLVVSILALSLSFITFSQEKIVVLEDTYVQGGETSDVAMGAEKQKQLNVFISDKETKYARTTYLKFELPKKVKKVSKITLYFNVKVYDKNAPGELFKLDVYAAKSNNWKENKLTWSNKPELGNMLGTVSLPATPKHKKIAISLDAEMIKKQVEQTKDNTITLALLNLDFNKTAAIGTSKEKNKKVAAYLMVE